MTTIGYATLQVIASLRGVTEQIDKEVDGKVVSVSIEPKVDQRAAESAAKQTRETVEKQTTQVKVEPKVDPKAADTAGKQVRESVEKQTKDVAVAPKVDQAAAENAGKTVGEAVGRGVAGSSTGMGQLIIGALEGAGGEAGARLGERLADTIPTGLTGAAERIGTALRNSLPSAGEAAGVALGTAIGVSVTNAIGAERLDRAGAAIASGLKSAVAKANAGADIGIAVGNTISNGLSSAAGGISGMAETLSGTVEGVTTSLGTVKELLGGDDSWAAPGLDALTGTLDTVTPLLDGMTAASTLASAGAQAISTATGIASKAQWLWNAALTANPIGLIVAAIAALVAGLVLFFTKTELGQKIWKAFTEYLSIAWDKVKAAFAVAWDAIRVVWDAMVAKAGEVWQGIKDRFTAVVDFVKGLPTAITNAARGMWDGLKNGLLEVLRWIADRWNRLTDALSFTIPDWVPVVGGNQWHLPKAPAFDGGGYTGNFPIDQVAGVVHGGEFVIRKTATDRLQSVAPGLLDALNGYKGGGLVAGTSELRKVISERFGISNIGGYRPADGFNEHSTGRALDVMVGNNRSQGDAVKDFALANSSAIDLKWVIWRQHLYYPGGGGYDMQDRGNPTANHMDHVHIFSGEGITNGLRGALKGQKQEPAAAAAPAPAPGAIDPTSTDTTASSTADVTPAAAASAGESSGGVSVPSSLSGLSTFGLSNLGVTTSTQIGDSSQERTLDVGSAVSSAVGGQVSSALGVLGVPDSPGWLQGISKFVGGISVSDKNGKKVFDGGNIGGTFGDAGSLFGGAAPVSASTPATAAPVPDAVHGAQAAQKPGPTFNTTISSFDTTDAVARWEQKKNEIVAAKVGVY